MYYVRMTDRFLSKIHPNGFKSVYVLACDTLDEAEVVEKNAMNRPEMKYIQICCNLPKECKGVVVTVSNKQNAANWYKPGAFRKRK